MLVALLILAGLASIRPAMGESELSAREVLIHLLSIETTGEWRIDLGGCTHRPYEPRTCYMHLAFERVDLAFAGMWFVAPFEDVVWLANVGRTELRGTVIRNGSQTFIAVDGQMIPVDFPEPEFRLEGYSREWKGMVLIRREVPADTPTPVANTSTPEPTPGPTPEPTQAPVEPRILVTLTTTSTSTPLVSPIIRPNHRIAGYHLLLGLRFEGDQGDSYRAAWSPVPIEPDERRRLNGVGIGRHWEDVTGLTLRTREGSTVRKWLCQDNTTRHDFERRLDCGISEVIQLPDLNATMDATLWVHLSKPPEQIGFDAYVRSPEGGLAPSVHLSYGDGFYDHSFCLHHGRELEAGVARNMACGGVGSDILRQRGNRYPEHTDVVDVVAVTGVGLMYCEKHKDSDDEHSIWACELW